MYHIYNKKMTSQFGLAYVLKPTIVGLSASILNRYGLGEQNMMRNVVFGGSTAISIAIASLTEPTFEKAFNEEGGFKVGKSFAGRVYEIAAGSAGSYLANKFIANNDPYNQDPYKLLAIVAFSDILGETVLQLTYLA